jgi:hypothetical protein
MTTDDIQTINTATGAATDTLAPQGAVALVSADSLERWTRAVTTTAPSSKEQDADSPAVLTKLDPNQPEQLESQPDFGRFDAARQAPSAPSTVRPGFPAPPQTGSDGPLPSSSAPARARPGAGFFLADTRTADVFSAQSALATAPSPASSNQTTAFSPATSLGAAQAMSTPATPTSSTTPSHREGNHSPDAVFSAQGAPAPLHKHGATVHNPPPSRSDELVGKATAELKSQSALMHTDVEATRALPLSALRGLHASHRHSRFDATLPDGVNAESSSAAPPTMLNATADLLMPRVTANISAPANTANEGVAAVGGNEQLHALIESCCSRLWVNDGGGRAPQGVMLDLGRWMPGCTVEVAKAAGVLRITLRGVDGAERARIEDELQGLGDALADKLGCKVVAAVATNKELT